MPSQHPNFEYDIFISYRQNDNKRDGWVTHFVEALQDELDATLKEPVSIYFDENPHDGLLESHLVSESLDEKLRCLVFIPILSQTYCDTSSYAWNKEFLSFLEMAREDEIGLNVKLRNGNVSSRILPVRIHDLDPEDEQVLNDHLGGPVRAIDFIYAEPGVNRPLTPTDYPDRNQNGTIYRNQINKVANALKEIGGAILNPDAPLPENKPERQEVKPKKRLNLLPIILIIAALGLTMAGYFYFKEEIQYTDRELAVAVLAFDDNSPTGDQEWLGNGVAEAIINTLNNIEGLKVIGKRSSFSFKGKDATIKEIGSELKVYSVIEGSVSKVGDRLRVNAQLIDADSELQLWDAQYDLEWGEIHGIMDDVASNIAHSLVQEFPEAELVYQKANSVVNPKAYEYYMKGIYYHWEKYVFDNKEESYLESEKNFLEALRIDPEYIDAYAGLADLYDSRWNDGKRDYHSNKRDSLIDIGYSLAPDNAYLLAIKGYKFSKSDAYDPDSAFLYLNKAYQVDSTHILVLTLLQNCYYSFGLIEEAIKVSRKILRNDPINRGALTRLYYGLLNLGKFEEAKVVFKELIKVDNTSTTSLLARLDNAFIENNWDESSEIISEIQKIDPELAGKERAILLAHQGKKEQALELDENTAIYSILGMKEEAINSLLTEDTSSVEYNYYLFFVNYKIFDLFRDDPRIIEFEEKLRKRHEEYVEKYAGFLE